jgi:hypothetical protein
VGWLNIQEIHLINEFIDILVCLQPEEVFLHHYIQGVLRIICDEFALDLIKEDVVDKGVLKLGFLK